MFWIIELNLFDMSHILLQNCKYIWSVVDEMYSSNQQIHFVNVRKLSLHLAVEL